MAVLVQQGTYRSLKNRPLNEYLRMEERQTSLSILPYDAVPNELIPRVVVFEFDVLSKHAISA